MRGSKAKRLRQADPSRPNPGRKHGGSNKLVPPANKLVPPAQPMKGKTKKDV